QAVSQRGPGGSIPYPQPLKTGHAPRVLGGLALRIVEVGGHGDDGLRDWRTEESLGVALELAQNVRRNLRRCESKLAELDARNFARLHVVRQAEGKELQLTLHFREVAAHK